MGIDISMSMSMGWGIHIPPDVFNKWLERNDPDGAGGWDVLDSLISGYYPDLTFDWVGNAWVGDDLGWVLYASSTYQRAGMRGGAEAGVYRAPKERLSLPGEYQLNDVSKIIAGEHLPIEWLVTVGVS